MFQKKQIIYSETLGLCRVENIVQLAPNKMDKPVEYYVLKPMFGVQQAAYLPTHNHSQVLRTIFTRKEAIELQENKELLEKNPLLKAAVDYVLAQQE